MKNDISAKAAYLNEDITTFKNMPMFQSLESIQNNDQISKETNISHDPTSQRQLQ